MAASNCYVCLWIHAWACHYFPPPLPHNASVGLSRKTIFPLAPPAAHRKELVARAGSGFVSFSVMWHQVLTGMQLGGNHYLHCHLLSSVHRSDIILTHQPLSPSVWRLSDYAAKRYCLFPLSSLKMEQICNGTTCVPHRNATTTQIVFPFPKLHDSKKFNSSKSVFGR